MILLKQMDSTSEIYYEGYMYAFPRVAAVYIRFQVNVYFASGDTFNSGIWFLLYIFRFLLFIAPIPALRFLLSYDEPGQ